MNYGTLRVRCYFARLIHFASLSLVLLLAARIHAQEFQFQGVGVRVGLPAEDTSNHFVQLESYLNYNLWRWKLAPKWAMQMRLDSSAGWLGKEGDNAAVLTLGPSYELTYDGLPLSLDGGSSPTYLSRYHFGDINLGANAQFTTYIGVNWDIASHWRIGYRYQHMSNAGIREPNPGFNLHVICLGYLF